jgi:hypothetical protein
MGAFNTLFQAIKATLAGVIPIGGTFVGSSETTPIVFAQNVKGGYFSVPNTDALADIPYEMLQVDMEVVVSQHTIAGPTIVPKKKYYLKTMPPTGLRVNEVVGFDLADYWGEISLGGIDGDPGDDGDDGWTPQIALETDGPNRVVQRVIGYTGGEGTPPILDPNQNYIGPTGFSVKSSATNVMGPQGPAVNLRAIVNLKNGINDGFNLQLSTMNWVLIRAVNITNSNSEARDFLVYGRVDFSKDIPGANNVIASVNLKYRASAMPPGIVLEATWTPDNTYINIDTRKGLITDIERDDAIVNADNIMETLEARGTITIPAGATYSVYVSSRIITTGGVNRNDGSINIIGL